jgi:hypothetical protein
MHVLFLATACLSPYGTPEPSTPVTSATGTGVGPTGPTATATATVPGTTAPAGCRELANVPEGVPFEPGPVTCPTAPTPPRWRRAGPAPPRSWGAPATPRSRARSPRSPPGDTISVCPGAWDEQIRVDGGRTLAAADPTPMATVLYSTNADPVLTSPWSTRTPWASRWTAGRW